MNAIAAAIQVANGCVPGNCAPQPLGTSHPSIAEGAVFALWLGWGVLGAYAMEQSNVGPSADAEENTDP